MMASLLCVLLKQMRSYLYRYHNQRHHHHHHYHHHHHHHQYHYQTRFIESEWGSHTSRQPAQKKMLFRRCNAAAAVCSRSQLEAAGASSNALQTAAPNTSNTLKLYFTRLHIARLLLRAVLQRVRFNSAEMRLPCRSHE